MYSISISCFHLTDISTRYKHNDVILMKTLSEQVEKLRWIIHGLVFIENLNVKITRNGKMVYVSIDTGNFRQR